MRTSAHEPRGSGRARAQRGARLASLLVLCGVFGLLHVALSRLP